MGTCYGRMGENKKAFQSLEKCIEIGPGFGPCRSEIKKFIKLK
jgi:hypothetical protein